MLLVISVGFESVFIWIYFFQKIVSGIIFTKKYTCRASFKQGTLENAVLLLLSEEN